MSGYPFRQVLFELNAVNFAYTVEIIFYFSKNATEDAILQYLVLSLCASGSRSDRADQERKTGNILFL